jgi:peptidyl-prolyl cis-trans isomerase SurA
MKKFKLFKLILIILFFFKLILTPSFADNNLEIESKLWETLDKNLKKQGEQKQKEQEEEEQRQKEREEQKLKQEEEDQRQKKREEQKLKQEEEEQRLKQEEEEQKQKEQREAKALLSKLFPKNELLIIAKIGNKIITSYDLEVEIKYLMALSPSLKNLTQEQKINSARESIIREKVKISEILKYFELGQEADYLGKVIADTYRKLGLKNQFEFNNYLSNYDLTIDDIKKKIEIEVLWNRLIYSKYKNQVEIDTEKIKKKLKEEELKLKNKEVFLLSEILFNAKNKEELDKKYIRILESIEKEGFKNTATIYSISDTAKFGGLIGWIQKNQLSDLVIDEILKINIGEFTKPINVPSGLLIIRIDKKKIKESKIDFDLELKKIIQYEKNKKLRQFSFIHYKKVKNNINIHEN